MARSRITRRFAAVLVALFALVAGGCAEKAASPDQLLANAKQARDKGQYRSAIIHLKNLLQKSPQHAEGRYLLGVTYNDAGDIRSAEAELRRAVDLRYDRAKITLGRPLIRMGEYQKVLDQIPPDANVGNTLQAEILTMRALATIGLGRRPEGRALLEQALAKEPEYADALLGLAMLAATERKPDEAMALAERAVASAPKNADAWLAKGDFARIKGDKAAALAAYQKILEFSPENVTARLNIASIQIADGNFDTARKQLDEARKIAPEVPLAKYLWALLEYRQKKYAAAREAVLQALKVTPDHLPSLLLAGMTEYALGSHEQAQSYLRVVVERAPGYLYARNMLIASLAKSGQTQRAIELLQPGLQQAPDDGMLMSIAGEVYLQNNELDKAVHYFERAAKLDPKSAGARIGLGVSRMASGDADRALADLESAAQLDSENYQADMLLVMSHVGRANYDQALQAMQSLEKKQPKNPLTYHLKASIYAAKKDAVTARKYYEQALALNPAYIPSATALAELDLQDKKPAEARRRLEAMLEKDRNNAQALIALAELGPRVGAKPPEVIAWLERARRASPAAVPPQLMLARAYAESGDMKKALEVAQQAQVANPDNLQVLDMLAAIQASAGAKEQSLATYHKLAAMQPKSVMTLFRLAVAQTANRDQRGAAETLRKVVALQPDFVDAQMALAALEIEAKRYSAATKIAQHLQKIAVKSPVGFILEGDVSMAENKFPQAAKAYESAYRIGRNSSVLVKQHAALTRGGKSAEANTLLEQRLKEAPEDMAVRLYIGEISLSNGNYPGAIEQYEWMLKKYPEDVLVLNNLAYAYQQAKDSRALETAERAYKLQPANAQVVDTLGWILVQQGNTKRGLELLQKAVALAAKPAPGHRYHYAQALIKTGDRARARQELQRLLADTPNSPYEKEAKDLLKDLRP